MLLETIIYNTCYEDHAHFPTVFLIKFLFAWKNLYPKEVVLLNQFLYF